ncbi:hypothetical protein BG011_000752 [Mortierella polycephala]|uniref:Uncharacterized protein n=1 Tax=Mortierella polycephala TaxID=41804 RepID=A0A9P6U6S9_9FUNG|nr:hypothetical protein BG011_000752 [Mortierella polycephala]
MVFSKKSSTSTSTVGSRTHQSSQQPIASFLKRKPVKTATAPSSVHSDMTSTTSPYQPSISSSQSSILGSFSSQAQADIKPASRRQSITSSTMSTIAGPPTAQRGPTQKNTVYLQTPSILPPTDATGMDKGVDVGKDIVDTPKTPKTFQQSQDELFTKLAELAAEKNKTKPSDPQKLQGQQQSGMWGNQVFNNKSIGFDQMQTKTQTQSSHYNDRSHSSSYLNNSHSQYMKQGSTSNASLKQQQQPRWSAVASHSGYSKPYQGSGSSYAPKTPPKQDRPREPRRRISSSQFKTPSTVEMAELAQVVFANAAPPKTQNRIRKRASTLSLTTSMFASHGSRNSSIVSITQGSTHDDRNLDYRQRYEAASRDAKNWEKKYSSSQQQLHYEHERWEEKYGELERTLRELESSKTEANIEKMNSLLDTVQQLQITNEAFRKQLNDAGIEPNPMPAAEFHPNYLLVGESLDRTFLEEGESMKERSLVRNQKIAHLSTEISNSAIAISQTINYVQLRFLTQMLDAAEHVSSQKRTRVMSNSFLSDMLSRGVKKAGPLQPRNTSTTATQTPSSILTAQQLQQQFMQQHLNDINGGSAFRPLDSKLNKSFSFTSSLLNLTGLSHGNTHSAELQYRLRGEAVDYRSQWIQNRSGISPMIIQTLKGDPTSPNSTDPLAVSRTNTPLPKFQYASPTTSELRIMISDTAIPNSFMTGFSVGSASGVGSVHNGVGDNTDGTARRSSSDTSLIVASHQQKLQDQGDQGYLCTDGKYSYTNHHASMPFSQKGMASSTSHQQFLSPEMTFPLHSNNTQA